MEKEAEDYQRIDARRAGWIYSSRPSLISYQLRCGVSLPRIEEKPHGRGEDWQSRAVAAVLRECYGRDLRRAPLESVEAAAISVLPEPEADEDDKRIPRALSVHARWETAVEKVSKDAHRILSHGPASGDAGGEVLFSGGVLAARVLGLPLEQRVDLLWRRPDGALEAVLVLEDVSQGESNIRGASGGTSDALFGATSGAPLASDWRCILATAVVAELYGEQPDLHLVLVEEQLAHLMRISEEAVVEHLSGVSRVIDEAQGASEDLLETAGTGEVTTYPLDPDMLEPSGRWREQTRRPPFGRRRQR